MVLADTSVWVSHCRNGNERLASILELGEVAVHPLIIGELACGKLPRRTETLALLRDLPPAAVAGHEEILRFIEAERLMGLGLGYVGVALLASARLSTIPLWTLDVPLRKVASNLGVLSP